jgi:hypothetical protein
MLSLTLVWSTSNGTERDVYKAEWDKIELTATGRMMQMEVESEQENVAVVLDLSNPNFLYHKLSGPPEEMTRYYEKTRNANAKASEHASPDPFEEMTNRIMGQFAAPPFPSEEDEE